MEWRIRTEKRMNAAEDKTTLSGAYKLERHLPEGMRRRMSALGDNPFNGASTKTRGGRLEVHGGCVVNFSPKTTGNQRDL